MNRPRTVVLSTLFVFLCVSVVSGPLVGGVDLTPQRTDARFPGVDAETGTLSVSDTAVPAEGYRLERGVAGSGVYTLSVPAATVEVESITGTVTVIYQLEIREIGYASQSLYTLDANSPETVTLAVSQQSIEADKIEQEEYAATATVSVRSNGTTRVLETANVTVDVEE
ncbi:hypothetical protein SAMN04487949_2927 [Halogranum gelatinilyticum]|uniref:Uncharacterized protein n=1 Tax=Halogranum gelatinilyticum TaxID=660521 RepID=A0A1G9XBZ4_9EURY|nr:hypothetical protein [Halogranum gelatinilyticum]SDM94280.1 hypothetical protein SAMN04487949_2927 [Halogranum gelatinilyticum]